MKNLAMPKTSSLRYHLRGGGATMTHKARALIEQHFHGAYGVYFNKCSKDDILMLSSKLKQNNGIGGIFPTLVTDTVENIRRQTEIIKSAALETTDKMAKILGIHLEGIFINPTKNGIHDEKLCLEPTIENFQKVEDDFIRIVTVAPELCKQTPSDSGNLINYLNKKGVKVQAGHCLGSDLTGCSGVTHIFNTMPLMSHKNNEPTPSLKALVNNNIYAEIIADGIHVADDMLIVLFKTKPASKIILISDSLPAAGLHLEKNYSFNFAGKEIIFDGQKLADANGSLAGSSKLLSEIIKIFGSKKIVPRETLEQVIDNPYRYHDISEDLGTVHFDTNWNLIK